MSNNRRSKKRLICVPGKEKLFEGAQIVHKIEMDKLLPGLVHQGVALETEPLQTDLKHAKGNLLLLDQVQDMRNVGAIIRTAAGFGVQGIVLSVGGQCPNIFASENYGVLAKAACGGLEHVDIIAIKNISTSIQTLKDMGYWMIGLDEEGQELQAGRGFDKTCLIIGQEGDGMRQLTRKHCDIVCSIPTKTSFGCLNASVAAGIGMYEIFANR